MWDGVNFHRKTFRGGHYTVGGDISYAAMRLFHRPIQMR